MRVSVSGRQAKTLGTQSKEAILQWKKVCVKLRELEPKYLYG